MPLDKYQQAVVDLRIPKDAALRVVANAGAGKSTTILAKIAAVIKSGEMKHWQICLISFSRKSVQDLIDKWKKDYAGVPMPHISTIHSLGILIQRQYLGNTKHKIIKPYEQMKTIRLILEELEIGGDFKANMFAAIGEISGFKSNCLIPKGPKRPSLKNLGKPEAERLQDEDDEDKSPIKWEDFKRIWKKYQAFLKENDYWDFDDLLMHTSDSLDKNPDALEKVRKRFGLMVVDEAQDLNKANWRLALQIAKGQRLIAVGDLCQNIYLFRWARPEFFSAEVLKEYFSKTKSMELPNNYRSHKDIVALCNLVRQAHPTDELQAIAASKRVGGVRAYTVGRANQEGEMVVKLVQAALGQGYKLSDITVICRSMRHIQTMIESHLIEHKIPYKILGSNRIKFMESDAVHLFSNLFAFCADTSNFVALAAIIPYLNGMGEFKRLHNGFTHLGVTAEKYVKHIYKTRGWTPLGTKHDDLVQSLIDRCVGVRKILKARTPESVMDGLDKIFNFHKNYTKEANRITQKQYARIQATLMNFIHDRMEIDPLAKLKDVISDLLLHFDATMIEDGQPEEMVTLSTVHAQKGLEHKVSIVCGFRGYGKAEDLGDELNILYVQLSRAIERLFILRSDAIRRVAGNTVTGVENEHLVNVMLEWEDLQEEG